MAEPHFVAVIGAGPAGIYAAKTLADAGHTVVIFNRDIKPGGLAEYGIYYDKHKMKNGLRKQFRKIFETGNLHYFGNVKIGEHGDFTLQQVYDMCFDAVVIAAGAQGTKWLGMPGEELLGVYHAKDVVYHYNQLPPFAEHEFHWGKRVALIGVGNVMVDIAHYAIRTLKVDEVTAFARRGPTERKYTDKEIEYVIANWDLDATKAELERIKDRMVAVGLDIDQLYDELTKPLPKATPKNSDTRMLISWLSSPAAILGDDEGKVRALVVDDTEIYEDGGRMKVRSVGTQREIPCDSVVFAIGDTVDKELGLPLNKWGEFDITSEPRFPVDGVSYEISGAEHIFATGWAREASTGLVGAARKDGTNAAMAVMQYLATKTPGAGSLDSVRAAVAALDHAVCDKAGWQKLEAIELARAQAAGVELYKFDTNDEMLAIING